MCAHTEENRKYEYPLLSSGGMRSVELTNSVQVLMASCQLWIKFSTFTKAARIFNATVGSGLQHRIHVTDTFHDLESFISDHVIPALMALQDHPAVKQFLQVEK